MKNDNVKVEINEQKVFSKISNETFGTKVAAEWKKLIDPFTPRDTGALMNKVKIEPFAIRYNSPYAHYQYTGVVYEDPALHVAGIPYYTKSGDIAWYSRPGVKKVMRTASVTVPTKTGTLALKNQYLVYNLAKNPFAQAEWDIAAEEAGKKEDLYRVMNEWLSQHN